LPTIGTSNISRGRSVESSVRSSLVSELAVSSLEYVLYEFKSKSVSNFGMSENEKRERKIYLVLNSSVLGDVDGLRGLPERVR